MNCNTDNFMLRKTLLKVIRENKDGMKRLFFAFNKYKVWNEN